MYVCVCVCLCVYVSNIVYAMYVCVCVCLCVCVGCGESHRVVWYFMIIPVDERRGTCLRVSWKLMHWINMLCVAVC
jgi:hypothetical protein